MVRNLVRYAAKGLALVWGGFWTFFALACSISEGMSVAGIAIHAGPFVLFLVGALIALRWDFAGGIVLLVEGLAIAVAAPILLHGPTVNLTILMLAAPPLVAGIMLLLAARRPQKDDRSGGVTG